jgi:solute carrier family 25 carnitine/acylcarnitine transporter 20/29
MENYISGCFGGMLGTFSSYPLDTYRIRKQTNKVMNKNLYSGVLSPLFGIAIEKAIVFGTYHQTKKYTNNDFLAGLNSGIFASIVVTPIEKFKILKQNNPTLTYSDISNKITKKGVVRGTGYLYNGLSACFFREVPGYAIYFQSYKMLNDLTDNKDKNNFKIMINGGLSGVISWLFIFPFDTIKTNMQQNNTDFWKTSKSLVKSKGLYNGLGLGLTRAFLLHSFVFLGYEVSKKILF